jgi:hypothetical protein
MRSSYGPRLARKTEQRPAGVGILATVGVLASLVTIMFTLVRLITQMRISVEPSRQVVLLLVALVVALVVLWINWGLWELIRWAWWANMVTSLLMVAATLAAVRYLPNLADALGRLWKGLGAQQLASSLLIALIVSLAYNLIAIVYMLGVHATFKVGVKDERPLWERVHRN